MAFAGVRQWSGCTQREYSSHGPIVRERRLPETINAFMLFGFYQRSSAANKTLSLHTDPVALGGIATFVACG